MFRRTVALRSRPQYANSGVASTAPPPARNARQQNAGEKARSRLGRAQQRKRQAAASARTRGDAPIRMQFVLIRAVVAPGPIQPYKKIGSEDV